MKYRLGLAFLALSLFGASGSTKAAKIDYDSLHGSSMAVHEGVLYVADTDNNAVVTIQTDSWKVAKTVSVPGGPEQIVVAPDGRAFVTLRWTNEVATLAPRTLKVSRQQSVGLEPWGIALSPDAGTVYVTSTQAQTLTALSARTLKPRWQTMLSDRSPRGIAVAPDGKRGYVVHLRSAVVSTVDLANGKLLEPMKLPSTTTRGVRRGPPSPTSSVVNRALSAAVTPDGKWLVAAFDLKNAGLGVQGRGAGTYGAGGRNPLVAAVGAVPLGGDARLPFVHHLRDMVDPSDVRISSAGRIWVTGAGPKAVMLTLNGNSFRPHTTPSLGYADALVVHEGTTYAYDPVAFEVRQYGRSTRSPSVAIGKDPLPAELAAGRALFFKPSHKISRMRAACQSCHPDGRHDGMVWNIDLGPRKTPILAGHVAHTAPYHWLGSAPTLEASVQETVARLNGNGLAKEEITLLANFVQHGLRPVPRKEAPKRMTASQSLGQKLFNSEAVGCAQCHNPSTYFQDGEQHLLTRAAGDQKAETSQALNRIDTPTLHDIGLSAPYMHDGSAPDLESVLIGFNRHNRMGKTKHLTDKEREALISYLETL